MRVDLDLFGTYVPALMGLALAAFAINLALRRVLARVGFYRLVWHPALFDVALFVIVLRCVAALSQRFSS